MINPRVGSFVITSPASINYNCIAWAAGCTSRWWWPHADSYWPSGVPAEETIEAFVKVYATVGYERCDNSELDETYEKIAIYAIEGRPTHAARQLEDGRWTSKLGEGEDIIHESLEALDCEMYGSAVSYLRRVKRAKYKDKRPNNLAGKRS